MLVLFFVQPSSAQKVEVINQKETKIAVNITSINVILFYSYGSSKKKFINNPTTSNETVCLVK